jgi:soluble lytic murein transglycosylase-like protein
MQHDGKRAMKLLRHAQWSALRKGPMRRIPLYSLAALVMLSASLPAHADCFDEAAGYQKVNPLILRAIAWQESHNHGDVLHSNTDGSIDYGLMQINPIHLPALAAWHLRRQMNRFGNTWQAVGAYHSTTPALRDQYTRQIVAILQKWNLFRHSTDPRQRWSK